MLDRQIGNISRESAIEALSRIADQLGGVIRLRLSGPRGQPLYEHGKRLFRRLLMLRRVRGKSLIEFIR